MMSLENVAEQLILKILTDIAKQSVEVAFADMLDAKENGRSIPETPTAVLVNALNKIERHVMEKRNEYQ